MEPRDIDRLIAHHIFNIEPNKPKRYSSNMSDAWSVVERLTGYWAIDKEIDGYHVYYNSDPNNSQPPDNPADITKATTAPLAICLTALRTVGIELKDATESSKPASTQLPHPLARQHSPT